MNDPTVKKHQTGFVMIDKNRQFRGRFMKLKSECHRQFGVISGIPLASNEQEFKMDLGAGILIKGRKG